MYVSMPSVLVLLLLPDKLLAYIADIVHKNLKDAQACIIQVIRYTLMYLYFKYTPHSTPISYYPGQSKR